MLDRASLARPSSRKDESAPITVIALSPPVPFHLGKVKSHTLAGPKKYLRFFEPKGARGFMEISKSGALGALRLRLRRLRGVDRRNVTK